MTISIRDLTFDAIIGILPHERLRVQKVVVQMQVDYTYHDTYLDYAAITALTKQLIQDEKFELLEEAILSLKQRLSREFNAIERLQITLSKPDILPDCEVALTETFNF